jgi:four helix bundle protein
MQDFSRFLQIAFGSVSELDCHLLLARDLGLLTQEAYQPLYGSVLEIRRMLAALIRTLNSNR